MSCRSTGASDSVLPEGDTLSQNATYLQLIDHKNGIISATIKHPWNEGQTLGKFLLVDMAISDNEIPNIEGYEVIRVPVSSALVFSSVHTSPIEELGAEKIIKGVADAEYFTSDYIRKGVASGNITNVGNSMSPSLERIIELSPDVAITSPYENSGHGVLDKVGVTVIDLADYMEQTPLGRAEWILLLGALTGKLDVAKNIYSDVVASYSAIKKEMEGAEYKPAVLTEIPYSGVWYQPGGKSYMAQLIRDAGGTPVLENDSNTGSVQLDLANALEVGNDADVWLIKSTTPLTVSGLSSQVSLANQIKAFGSGNVWVANTSEVPLYDDLAFHPEKILRDYGLIFHPEKFGAEKPAYFQRIH